MRGFRDPDLPERRALLGALLALGAPLGWLAIRVLAEGASPGSELAASPRLYFYLLASTVVAFAAFGYVLGGYERELGEANGALERLTRMDALTRLENRGALAEALPRLASFARRTGTPLSLIAIDLDGFKAVNDRFGHIEGDELLKRVGHALAQSRRVEDIVARTGGDEFVIVLPGMGLGDATRAAERALGDVGRLHVMGSGDAMQVTASAGVAELGDGDERALHARADEALYLAKRTGRARVVADASATAAPDLRGVESITRI